MISKSLCLKHDFLTLEVPQRMLTVHVAAGSSRMEKDVGRTHSELHSSDRGKSTQNRNTISPALLLKNTFPKSKAHKLLYFRVRLWKSKNLVNTNGK